MKLVEARKAARMTQDEVAGYLGISRPTYARMEKSPEIISVGDASKLAELFKVEVDQIFFESNYKQTYSQV